MGLSLKGFELEACMGMEFPWEWSSFELLMGMGIAYFIGEK